MIEVIPLTDRSALVRGVPREYLSPVSEYLLAGGFDTRRGLEDILVVVEQPSVNLINELESRLASFSQKDNATNQFNLNGRETVVPVVYDGEDLTRMAKALGVTPREIVEIHQGLTWTVAMIGFAPGFPYLFPSEENVLSGLPRLANPRERVPQGSVGVAAGMSCIYPSAMPGGWNLIGSTELTLFEPDRESPSLLSAGDTVVFREVS